MGQFSVVLDALLPPLQHSGLQAARGSTLIDRASGRLAPHRPVLRDADLARQVCTAFGMSAASSSLGLSLLRSLAVDRGRAARLHCDTARASATPSPPPLPVAPHVAVRVRVFSRPPTSVHRRQMERGSAGRAVVVVTRTCRERTSPRLPTGLWRCRGVPHGGIVGGFGRDEREFSTSSPDTRAESRDAHRRLVARWADGAIRVSSFARLLGASLADDGCVLRSFLARQFIRRGLALIVDIHPALHRRRLASCHVASPRLSCQPSPPSPDGATRAISPSLLDPAPY